MWEKVRVIPFGLFEQQQNPQKQVNWVPQKPEDFHILRKMKQADLLKIGMQIWDVRNQKALFLFPVEWYDYIPDGFTIYDIFGEREKFSRASHKKEQRFGCLPYGMMIEMR